MALFREIPLGDVLYLGEDRSRYTPQFQWRKVDADKVLSVISVKAMRYSESPMSNFYQESAVFNWLSDEKGFLQYFSAAERNVLMKFPITCNTPRSKRREFGRSVSLDVIAALPSINELNLREYYFPNEWRSEANNFHYQMRYDSIPTRSASGEKSLYIKTWGGGLNHIGAGSFISVHPVLSFDPWSEWEKSVVNGVWQLVEPVLAIPDDGLLSVLAF